MSEPTTLEGLDAHALLAAYRAGTAWTVRVNLINATNAHMPFTPTQPTGNRYWYAAAGRQLGVSASHRF